MATNESYIGKGIVYVNGRDVGNVTEVTFSIAEEKKELKSYRSAGGGNYNALTRIDSVTMEVNFSDYSADNLAISLFGSTSAVTAAAVTDESITAPSSLAGNPLVDTANVMDTAQSVTVTSDPAGTTYTEGTDYTIAAAGIIILEAGSISADDDLLISYTKKAVNVVEALTSAAGEYVLIFDGLNEAKSGAPVVIKVHRAKFGPAAALSVMGDEFGTLEMTSDVLEDTSITGSNLSKYFQVKLA